MTPSDAKPGQPAAPQPQPQDRKSAGAPATPVPAEVDSESVAGEEDPGAALDSTDFPDTADGSMPLPADPQADDDAPPDPDLEAAGRRSTSRNR